MEVHEILIHNLQEKYGLRGTDYCYTEENGRKGVFLTFPLDSYDKIPHDLKLVVDELIFTKKVRGRIDEKLGTIEHTFFYTLADGVDVSNDITADGTKKYGVICPKGKFYQCGYAGHHNLEYWLTERSLISTVQSYKDTFELNSWVKLTGASITDVEFVFSFTTSEYDYSTKKEVDVKHYKLTKEQVDTMLAYIKSLGRELIHFNYEFYTVSDFPKILESTDIHDFRRKYSVTDEVENPTEELYKSMR